MGRIIGSDDRLLSTGRLAERVLGSWATRGPRVEVIMAAEQLVAPAPPVPPVADFTAWVADHHRPSG
jgi:hypothetical protein